MPVSLEASLQIERHAEYIIFARMSGASNLQILWRYILPNVLPPLVIVIIQHLGDAIILVASFSLIGIGVQPPDPEWGAILLSSRDFLQTAPWLLIYPGLAIFITVVYLTILVMRCAMPSMYLVNRTVYRFFYSESLDEAMYFKGDIMKRWLLACLTMLCSGSSLGWLR